MKKMNQVKRATGTCKVVFEREAMGRAAAPISGDKHFCGALEGSSKREAFDISDHHRAGPEYMHVERVAGTLDGRSGTFLLAYSGIKDDGTSFAVVSGSGTGALSGISGTMTIRIRGGEQVYDLEYTLSTPTSRVVSLPQSAQGAPNEQQGDIGHVVRSVLAAISVLANQQVALQKAGTSLSRGQRIVQQ